MASAVIEPVEESPKEEAHPSPSNVPAEEKEEASPTAPASSTTSDPPASSTPASPSKQNLEDLVYQVKWVGSAPKTAVVTQNENGPCPLLAIANILLARGQISLNPDTGAVTSGGLLERVADCVLRVRPATLPPALAIDYEANLSEAVSLLPTLATGIDVNVKFTNVRDFEYTKECIIFDLLGISLYHGWLVDAEDEAQVAALINSQSYNQLVESVLNKRGSKDAGKVEEAALVQDWLTANASQLTYPGLIQLHATLRDGERAVLFRNNHFSTLLKNRDELFTLVTDQGFLDEPRVVWETLASVDGGDSHFVDASFHSFPATSNTAINSTGESTLRLRNQQPNADPQPATTDPANHLASDLQLALSLQVLLTSPLPPTPPSTPPATPLSVFATSNLTPIRNQPQLIPPITWLRIFSWPCHFRFSSLPRYLQHRHQLHRRLHSPSLQPATKLRSATSHN